MDLKKYETPKEVLGKKSEYILLIIIMIKNILDKLFTIF